MQCIFGPLCHTLHILHCFCAFLCREVAHREGVVAQPLVVYNCHPDIFKSPAVCTKMCSKFANQYVLAHWSSPLLLTILQTINNCNQPHSGAVNIIAWQALLLLISFLYLRVWSLIYQSMLPVHWRASNAYFNPSIQTDAAIHRRKMGLTNDITWTWTEWMAFIQKLFLLKFHQNVFQHIT